MLVCGVSQSVLATVTFMLRFQSFGCHLFVIISLSYTWLITQPKAPDQFSPICAHANPSIKQISHIHVVWAHANP